MLGYYNYSVVLTYVSLMISTLGIFQAMNEHIMVAVFCLMLSGLCDMFDGKIAAMGKRTEDEKRFGIQIDSLCDLVCFGVLPAVIGYQVNKGNVIYIMIAGVYLLAALIRLAFFNVKEEQRQDVTIACRKSYQGLPVTSIALIIPITFFAKGDAFPSLYSAALAVTSICYLLPFTIRKPKLAGILGMLFCGCLEFVALITGGLK